MIWARSSLGREDRALFADVHHMAGLDNSNQEAEGERPQGEDRPVDQAKSDPIDALQHPWRVAFGMFDRTPGPDLEALRSGCPLLLRA
jgi:hypothetical protein